MNPHSTPYMARFATTGLQDEAPVTRSGPGFEDTPTTIDIERTSDQYSGDVFVRLVARMDATAAGTSGEGRARIELSHDGQSSYSEPITVDPGAGTGLRSTSWTEVPDGLLGGTARLQIGGTDGVETRITVVTLEAAVRPPIGTSDDPANATLRPSETAVSVGERIAFSVSDTSGDERWIESLEWTFGDGTSATGWWNAHRYDDPGEYEVTLTATDNRGRSTTDIATISVSDLVDPIARIQPGSTKASVGERIAFSVSDTSGDERWIESLEWTFGDGTSATGWWNAHRYDDPSEYEVTLTATDNTGQTTTDKVTIAVSDE